MKIDELNREFYEKPENVKDYTRHNRLWAEEKWIFEHYQSYIKDKLVLDIGCGGGRTTVVLSELAANYTGIDYALSMVNACKQKYPTLNFLHGDASHMDIFDNASFDFAFFSFNGIDCMSQSKRIRTLKEIFRLLKPGGCFAFSSHNLDDRRIVKALDIRDINVFRNIQNFLSYWQVKDYQVITDSYQILSDPLAGFGHLTYYIRLSDQIKQIEEIGFCNIQVINTHLETLNREDLDCQSHWLHYICHKPRQSS